MKIHDALARNFVAEGVDTYFCLLGDANMHWAIAMDAVSGMRGFHARHEHCAVAMAAGYASATGGVGVASVTCGPGVTQLMTALASAARDNLPVVVFAGESPMHAPWYIQEIDQAPLVVATGAAYIAIHSPKLVHHQVQEAFRIARFFRKPVVLGVPFDLQKQELPDLPDYEPSIALIPEVRPIIPDPGQIAEIADRLRGASSPLLIAGRGALQAGAEADIEALADRVGALLGTTLAVRGAFDHHPYSLGVIGGYGRAIAREIAPHADLVLTFGASLSAFTQSGGRMFANASVVQIDIAPTGRQQGIKTGDMHLRADAGLAARALLEALEGGGDFAATVRQTELAFRIRDEPADDGVFEAQPETVDPRELFERLESLVPGDFDVVCGSGHQAYFHAVMRGGDPRRYHSLRDFGAIGNSLSYAIGVAAARGNNGRVVLYEGDGSLLMHIQEFECISRHGLKMLIVICNDGAYGAEIHSLRKEGVDDSIAIFGRPDFGAIAKAFGLDGAAVTELGQLDRLAEDYDGSPTTVVWDVHVNDNVMSPSFRLGSKAT